MDCFLEMDVYGVHSTFQRLEHMNFNGAMNALTTFGSINSPEFFGALNSLI